MTQQQTLSDMAKEEALDFFYCDRDEDGNRAIWEPFKHEDENTLNEYVEMLQDAFIRFHHQATNATMR